MSEAKAANDGMNCLDITSRCQNLNKREVGLSNDCNNVT